MKVSTFLFISLSALSLYLLPACGPEKNKQEEQKEMILPDSVDTEGMVETTEDCSGDLYQICNQGLSFAPLGYKMAFMHASDLEGAEEADSLDYEMGYVRLNRSIRYKGGFILLEGDALTEEDATDKELSDSRLSRIRIESQAFKTSDGVHSGMALTELKKLYKEEEIEIISFASIEDFKDNPAYHFLILNPIKHPNITYLLPDPEHKIYRALGSEEISLKDLPNEGQISSIVISV